MTDLDRQLAQLEVKLLREQFSPHFLFNNLSAINHGILHKCPKAASHHLMLFSKLLRRILANSLHDFTKLSEEIETIRLYIQVESMRYHRSISFKTTFDEDISPEGIWIPSLLLYAFAESAIWNSFIPDLEEISLHLRIHSKEGRRHIILEGSNAFSTDNSSPSAPLGCGSGLSTATERVLLLNQRHGIDMQLALHNSGHGIHEAGSHMDISFTPFGF